MKCQWQPIETAPKGIVARESYGSQGNCHELGPYILAFPVFGGVARVRWWQVSDDHTYCNFLEDGGNAVRPTHWMPLPKPPTGGNN